MTEEQRERRRAYSAAWRAENRASIKVSSKTYNASEKGRAARERYYQRNKARMDAAQAAYMRRPDVKKRISENRRLRLLLNPELHETIKAKHRARHHKNREVYNEKSREYRAKHKLYFRIKSREWARKNREKCAASNLRYKAAIREHREATQFLANVQNLETVQKILQ